MQITIDNLYCNIHYHLHYGVNSMTRLCVLIPCLQHCKSVEEFTSLSESILQEYQNTKKHMQKIERFFKSYCTVPQ